MKLVSFIIINKAGENMTKRILAFILIAAVLSAILLSSVVIGTAAVVGDVDGNDELTILDATAIQRHLAALISLSEEQQARGRVSGGDELTIIDATLIQRKLAQLIDFFPVEENTPPTEDPSATPTSAPTQPVTTAPTQEPATAPTAPPTQAPTEINEVTKVKDNITVYFSNNQGWSRVNAYIYNNAAETAMTAWPGTAMRLYTTNSFGEQVYSVTVDVTKYDRIIFNNGSVQTTDTPLTKANSGYFIIGESNGKLLAGLYPYGQDGEGNLATVSMNYPDGYKKNVYIWTPEGYNANDKTKKYSVLYMCDGQNLFGQMSTLSGYEWECDETVLSLMQNGGDGVVVVGVACGDTEAQRNHELTPNLGRLSSLGSGDVSYQNGGGKVFSDFMVDTVIPYVEKNYNTNSMRGIAGSSSGGIEAFYIGMEHMDKFSYIGALSPAFILYDKAVWDTYLNTKDFSGNVPRIYFFNGNGNDSLEKALYNNAVAMQGWMTSHGYPTDKMVTVVDNDAVHSEAFWALYFPEMLSFGLDI